MSESHTHPHSHTLTHPHTHTHTLTHPHTHTHSHTPTHTPSHTHPHTPRHGTICLSTVAPPTGGGTVSAGRVTPLLCSPASRGTLCHGISHELSQRPRLSCQVPPEGNKSKTRQVSLVCMEDLWRSRNSYCINNIRYVGVALGTFKRAIKCLDRVLAAVSCPQLLEVKLIHDLWSGHISQWLLDCHFTATWLCC